MMDDFVDVGIFMGIGFKKEEDDCYDSVISVGV